MRARKQQFDSWDNEEQYGANDASDASNGYDAYNGYAGGYGEGQYADVQEQQYAYNDNQYQYGDTGADPEQYGLTPWDGGDAEQGLVLQPENSLVGVSNTVTHHGAPLLSYTRTMNRFYTSRKQKMSLGRYKCEVCHERIRFWAWETPNGQHTHDGCYERMAWAWTNLYAQQQALASMGKFE